ncbi:MAG: anaerobic ribonucleoside-triphosphate reductase activating protein [candidate division WOR-3 bacterium]|nr:MAG: anaerobic ribonucleoside-triphosphate reductase activating protein [candidate division WOR-3 bacterium]
MIRALIETSLVDWDGKISMVLFVDKCNFMCPFCQNWELILHPEKFPVIQWKEIAGVLQRKKGWIDGVVLTGGEPFVYTKEIRELAENIKKLNLGLKVDTNGAYPEALKELIDKKLLDYVALDVKAPIDERYYSAAGKKINLENVRESIRLLLGNVVDYEFRTTCVPGIIDEGAIDEIGQAIKGARKWVLQVFVPNNAYKEEYRKELDLSYAPLLKKFRVCAQKYVSNTILRGKV